MRTELSQIVGPRVKSAREAANLTQTQLAHLIDRSRETISNIEFGVTLPGLDTLDTICDVTNVPLSAMLQSSNRDIDTLDQRRHLKTMFSRLTVSNQRLLVEIAKIMLVHSGAEGDR